jgi:Tol biopolymer transport system component
LDRATLTRLTFEGDSHTPNFSGDGQYIYAGVEGAFMRSIYRVPVDGSTPLELVWKGDGPQIPGRGPADDSMIPFSEDNSRGDSDIWVLSLTGEPSARPFLETPFNEQTPAFSPDGAWIAYASDESGDDQVYIRPYPGPGGKLQVSTDGGTAPVWSANGKSLFYTHGSAMMTVDIDTSSERTVSSAQQLFEVPFSLQIFGVVYDAMPDGQSFVMVKPTGRTGKERELHVVLNWFEELKAKVPVGGQQ